MQLVVTGFGLKYNQERAAPVPLLQTANVLGMPLHHAARCAAANVAAVELAHENLLTSPECSKMKY